MTFLSIYTRINVRNGDIMCQVNTFMFKESELDGEKFMQIIKVFQDAGFTNFYEYRR